MAALPIGWATDIAVLQHTGSTVEDRGDHLVLRSPANPGFHWGNCLFVTDPDAVDDASRWLETFHAAFPEAGWVAIGLTRMPEATEAWAAEGVGLELDDVLATAALPRGKPRPEGYRARQLERDDWEQVVRRAVAENERTGEYATASYERFVRERTRGQRELCERRLAAFFGAFADDLLVADLGIVCCGEVARYQNVGTDPEHRRRGLASHLLGCAAQWAAEQGCDRFVIVTEATNPAGRVYRSVGFEPTTPNAQAYRRPAR